jgi:hypothetical protein
MRLALVKSVLPTSPSLQSQQEHFKQSSCQKESRAWVEESITKMLSTISGHFSIYDKDVFLYYKERCYRKKFAAESL